MERKLIDQLKEIASEGENKEYFEIRLRLIEAVKNGARKIFIGHHIKFSTAEKLRDEGLTVNLKTYDESAYIDGITEISGW